jgi:DNA-binding CsgD family transcriptional regulator
MTPTDAVRLALGAHADAAGPIATGPALAPAGPATALTQREHEVVALLAAGLSNRDIAAKLLISPATAARHVANILAKLGFSSRSQVAAWATAQPAGQLAPNSALTDSPS